MPIEKSQPVFCVISRPSRVTIAHLPWSNYSALYIWNTSRIAHKLLFVLCQQLSGEFCDSKIWNHAITLFMLSGHFDEAILSEYKKLKLIIDVIGKVRYIDNGERRYRESRTAPILGIEKKRPSRKARKWHSPHRGETRVARVASTVLCGRKLRLHT